jgi:hypothetical protein
MFGVIDAVGLDTDCERWLFFRRPFFSFRRHLSSRLGWRLGGLGFCSLLLTGRVYWARIRSGMAAALGPDLPVPCAWSAGSCVSSAGFSWFGVRWSWVEGGIGESGGSMYGMPCICIAPRQQLLGRALVGCLDLSARTYCLLLFSRLLKVPYLTYLLLPRHALLLCCWLGGWAVSEGAFKASKWEQ